MIENRENEKTVLRNDLTPNNKISLKNLERFHLLENMLKAPKPEEVARKVSMKFSRQIN